MKTYPDTVGLIPNVTSAGEQLNRFIEFIDWLQSLGIRTEASRIQKYRRFLEQRTNQKDFLKDEKNVNDAFFFGREVEELLWIYSGLKICLPEGAIPVLKKMVGGDPYSSKEYSNTKARNFQLELRIAVYFIKAGYSVDLSQDSDVVVYFSDATLYVECKRLDSSLMVHKRAKALAKQLKARYSLKRKCFGLAVFDVGRIINPNQGMSIGKDSLHARDGIRDLLVNFVSMHDIASVFSADQRIVSVWVQALTPTLHMTERMPVTRFSSNHISLAKKGSGNEMMFNRLKSVFEIT
jgi:hypothetical protein